MDIRSEVNLPLALGTSTFGWTCDSSEAHRVLDSFVGSGGTLVDTSDRYSVWVDGHAGGEAESIVGAWLQRTSRRDDVLLSARVGRHPHLRGLAPGTVVDAVMGSLRRLGTDHVDVLVADGEDPSTPVAETARALDALVRAGSARLLGVSNHSAERVREWIDLARRESLAAPTVLLPQYNLVSRRAFERDLRALAADQDLAVLPHYALASGFLTGKYRSLLDTQGTERSSITQRFYSPAGLEVVDAVRELATTYASTPSAVALAWLNSRPSVVAPIVSVRDREQLADLLEVASLRLAPDELRRLDRLSDPVTT